MVNLVQDHERLSRLSPRTMQQRLIRDLRVRDGNTNETPAVAAIGVFEVRVNRKPDAARGVCPLCLQMLGWRNHGDAVDGATLNQRLSDT